MMKLRKWLAACAALVSLMAGAEGTVFVGTEGMGNTSPAATVPFGMVQPGPDTTPVADGYRFDKHHCGGYQHSDGFLWRFSQTHLSGMGVPAGGNVAILPQVAGETGECAAMDKATECGEPGYYAVTLKDGIRCEATASDRTAVYRFTYPQGAAAELPTTPKANCSKFLLRTRPDGRASRSRKKPTDRRSKHSRNSFRTSMRRTAHWTRRAKS